MLDVYLYENGQLLDDLESLLLVCEKNGEFDAECIGDIFRILHTVKGSSAMMSFDNIAALSHVMEDLFGYLREHSARKADHRKISDFVFASLDAIKAEYAKLQSGADADGDFSKLTAKVKAFYDVLTNRKAEPAQEDAQLNDVVCGLKEATGEQHCYKAQVHFEKECKMENIRALGIVKSIEKLCTDISTDPKDLLEEHSTVQIVENGFTLYMMSDEPADTLVSKIREAFFIRNLEFEEISAPQAGFAARDDIPEPGKDQNNVVKATLSGKQNFMSVNLSKLDYLMDIVGELVITESTVTKNPEVLKLNLDSFEKATRQLRKLTDELQDIVMSIRMVPVSGTFHKMERIVRDMSSKEGKQARLNIIGEETELDKNVLDNLSDPLMHIVRNAMDHGIETDAQRSAAGKDPMGQITLEAYNSGSDVIITVSDDGRGLDKNALIKKGISKGLIKKDASEVTDKEAFALVFMPGFSTKDTVTEYSGRGVGMDVAKKNIERLGGAVSVDSVLGQGTTVKIRIPLTLAIIDGMLVSVGSRVFILPLLSIKESFKPSKRDIIKDPDGNEMIHTRGNCYPIIRLHKIFDIETDITDFEDGIMMLLETQTRSYCVFVDSLLDEQQTVVKPLPVYISNILGAHKSISGCTILGDGRVSLILDINGLIS
jgi:two-component system chemotaxis sensor kinase CheA